MFAHSLPTTDTSTWEPLSAHLRAVAYRAAAFAQHFGWAEAAWAAGALHDIGKASATFQAYIAQPRQEAGGPRGPDHSTAGAREAARRYPGALGRMIASAIAAHHAGLADAAELERRLVASHPIPDCAAWPAYPPALPEPAALRPTRWCAGGSPFFGQAFLTRMIFSCLVDADFLETEAFHDRAEGRRRDRGGHRGIVELRDRLASHMAKLDGCHDDAVSRLRSRVLAGAREKASLSPGLFTLTVPTGGGKTLASLSFALDHAARHGLRRVIYVAPFTAIIEQTADVIRTALGSEEDVLEHHAQVDWSDAEGDGEGPTGLSKLRLATENWDVPIVVTTAVQFFESLFASRTSQCRKLHNLARSVIVLDEAQVMPIHLLRPCMAAIDELARNYGATVVLCTATQPALRAQDGFQGGLDIPQEREIAPDPVSLYSALKRVRIEVLAQPQADSAIVARFASEPQMLCIVNSRAHARALFEAARHLPGTMHLSTLMVPRHRRAVLMDIRRRLGEGAPVRIVSTSLIEAGVDLDLPEVWRAVAGLDSIAQASGRCNRHGRLESGRVVVFEPKEAKAPRVFKAFWQAARPVLAAQVDPLGLEAVRAYFNELYWRKGPAALDALEVDGIRGVLPAIAAGGKEGRFPFKSLAAAFRMIDDAMVPVIVPVDAEGRDLLAAVAAADRPPTPLLRALQGYSVAIPPVARQAWLARGALRPVHPALGDALLTFEDDAHYRPQTGLDLAVPMQREAELNIF